MAKQHRDILGQPVTRRRYGFAVTPLADAMFQLLVFFMLTSSLTPYSLIALKSGGVGSTVEAVGADKVVELPDNQVAIWQLSRGHIRAKDTEITLDQLDQVVPAMKQAGIEQVVIVTTGSATTQDLAKTIELLTINEISQVQVVTRQR